MEINRDADANERSQPASTPPDDESVTRPRSCLGNWRRWIRPVFYVAYGLVIVTAVPLIILDIFHAEERNFQITLAGVGFFAMVISIPISVWGIINHIMCYTRPALQKYIIRILWLVPIFELNSWFALRFPATEIYLDTLRQLYQAYVIYNYVFYLLAFYEEVPDFHNRLIMKPQIKSPPPCCCVKAVPNQRIINRCKAGVLNYTVIRIVVSVISIITDLLGKFNEGNYSPKFAYLWVTIMVTVSQIWAIFCMVLLRKATREELKMLPRSTAQFVGIQMVIFFTNFQSAILNLLAQFGAINPKPEWGYENAYAFATMLQNCLMCIELVLGAIVFSYSFDYQRYNTDSERRMILSKSFKQMWNVSDVQNNIMEHLRLGGPSFTSQHGNDSAWADQLPDSPTSIQSPSIFPPTAEVIKTPRSRRPGHEVITLPDIVLNDQSDSNHRNDSDHTAEIHSSRNQNCGDVNQDGGIENGGFATFGNRGHDENRNDDGVRVDSSGDTDDLIDGEFSSDDDDDDDHDNKLLPIDPRLDNPPGTPQKRRVKKVSFSGMTLDDMDWEHIKSHRSPLMDSEVGVAKETENSSKDGEGFGSSDAN